MASKNQGILDASDLRSLKKIFLRNWYSFIIFPAIAFGGGYLYSYQLTDIYAAKVQILIKSDDVYDYQKGIYRQLGYQGGYEEISNQMRVVKSQNLISDAVSRLNLDVSYYVVGRFKTSEVYKKLPFTVTASKLNGSHYNKEINLRIVDDNSFELWYEHNGAEYRDVYPFGKQLLDNDLSIKINKNKFLVVGDDKSLTTHHYMFKVRRPQSLVGKYKSATSVRNLEWTAIMEIKTEDVIPKRAVAFLDTLSAVYINYTTQSKFDININTQKYIDRQIAEVTTILSGIEDEIEDYKESKDILNLSREEQRYFDQLINSEMGRESLNLRLKSLDDLEDYILNSDDERLLPSSFYLEAGDEYLGASLRRLYNMQIQKNSILFDAKQASKGVSKFDKEMNLLKKDILTYLQNTRDALTQKKEHLNNQVNDFKGILKGIPKTQRQLLEIERKRQVNEKLYLFLLEKRANTIIARAGIIPETKIIESPHSVGRVKPDKEKIIYSFVAVGFAISLLIAFLRSVLFYKIETGEELKEATELTVLGELIEVKENVGDYLVVDSDPKSPVTEAFRVLRTNLDYLITDQKSKVIMITSNNPGEGKTFCSVNLGAILAKAGKRVLIIEMDLHKPRVHKALQLPAEKGSSSILIGKSNFEEVIEKSSIENFDAILSGPMPPNPSEILLNNSLESLLNQARENYDYVIIDTPPIGLITDALVLMKYSDVNLFVLNTKVTNKKSVKKLEDIVDKSQAKNVGLILNGVKRKKSGYYYKYYGYSYGYNSGKS